MYQVRFSRRAQKDLASLQRSDQMRVLKRLDAAAKDPARLFMPLKGLDGFRLRVGDLRVLVDIQARAQVIIVATIGKRENVYE